MKSAWVVVDLVNDFVSGKFGSERASKVVEKTADVLSRAGERLLTVFTLDSHVPGDPEFKVWGEHCLTGTRAADLDDRLKPYYSYGIRKRRYDAFLETDLDAYLRMHDIRKIYISGIATEVCVIHTVAGAFFRYYDVSVIEDLCTSISKSGHDTALEQMQRYYGTKIISASQFENEVA